MQGISKHFQTARDHGASVSLVFYVYISTLKLTISPRNHREFHSFRDIFKLHSTLLFPPFDRTNCRTKATEIL